MENDLSLFIAFSAGLLSFLSPCILPLIPTYLTVLMGDVTEKSKKRSSLITPIIFIFSFSLVFIILGISASFLGRHLITKNILRQISGLLVIILGLHLLGIINIKWLNYETNFSVPMDVNKYLRAVIMGLALGLAWTPCIGPVLSSILIYAGNSQNIMKGFIFLTSYSLGLAIPFLIIAIFFKQLVPRLKLITRYIPIINKITGILVILIGILILTDNLNLLII